MALDHQYIEEHGLAERYLRRTLPQAERAAFEEHFADCPECLDRLALAEMFRDTVRGAVAGQLARERGTTAGLITTLAAQPPRKQAILLALAVLLLAGSPSAFFLGSWYGFRIVLEEEAARSNTTLLTDVPVTDGETYCAVAVLDSSGRVVWAHAGLRVEAGQRLAIPMSFERLPPGEYSIQVRGRGEDGSTKILREYRIQNRPPPGK